MTILGKFLYGSQNYLLDNKDSDKDYGIVVLPDWKTVYYGKKMDKHQDEHTQIWDVRTFFERVSSANINALEMLFSTEQEYYDEDFKKICEYVRENVSWVIANSKNDLFHCLQGNAKQSYLRDKTNRKQVSRAVYFLSLLEELVDNNFEMTENSWRNPRHSYAREIRYLENAPLPSYEEVFSRFEEISQNQIWEQQPTLRQQEFFMGLRNLFQQFVLNKIYDRT